MRKDNILIDAKSAGLTVIEKMDWDLVDDVQTSLYLAFHPNENDEIDDKFICLFRIFLSVVGWTEDEYWAELENRKKNHTCPACKAEKEKQDAETSKKEAN